MPDIVAIDFTNPIGNFPTEAMDWNIGNPFNITKFYPGAGQRLFLGRVHDCAHTKYWIDGGLVLELEATAVNQNFGLFVDRPAQAVDEIMISVRFDFVQSLKRTMRTSEPPHKYTVPFLGAIGVIATDADVTLPFPSPANVIGATCPHQYDPESTATGGGAPPDKERLKLNGPGAMYKNPRFAYPFHEFDFLRSPLSPNPPGGPSTEFTLEMTATANPAAATTVMSLSQSPASFPKDNDGHVFTSKFFTDFGAIKYAGVALSITDASTDWLQPSMGPLRARIKQLTVEFRP